MVDNFQEIRKHLLFTEKNDVYVVKVIVRKKDQKTENVLGSNEKERIVKAYYIYDLEYFDKHIESIKALCKQNNARAYISSQSKKGADAIEILVKRSMDAWKLALKNVVIRFKPEKTAVGCFDECSSSSNTRWMVDVDFDSTVSEKEKVDKFTEILLIIHKYVVKAGKSMNEIYYVPSVNGYHIVTPTFNIKEAQSELPYLTMDDTVKKNAMILLYYEN